MKYYINLSYSHANSTPLTCELINSYWGGYFRRKGRTPMRGVFNAADNTVAFYFLWDNKTPADVYHIHCNLSGNIWKVKDKNLGRAYDIVNRVYIMRMSRIMKEVNNY